MKPFSFPTVCRFLRFSVVLLSFCLSAIPGWALQGAIGVHDPSRIIKAGDTYWVFGTGDGIATLWSKDLVQWNAGAPVFTANTRPSWINSRVPQFGGNFWAPDIFFMNGKYYLYYSCSTFGSSVSAIGVATNVTLDPTSPNFSWQDQGEVVYTTAASNANAIDPGIFIGPTGSVWMVYGSYWSGLKVIGLNPTTGKSAGTGITGVANGDREAGFVQYHEGYYYLFLNNGSCCQGLNSTYYMQVGRSTSPTGPYRDKTGAALSSGGGTTLLNRDGRYIGPGHPSIYEENGVSYLSHHFYDQYENGAPKLNIAKLTWGTDGWPIISRDWLPQGRFELENKATGLLWETVGCTGSAGQTLQQTPRAQGTCQYWDLTALGRGDYVITSTQGGLAAGTVGCVSTVGTGLALTSNTVQDCNKIHIEQAADGSYVVNSLADSRTNINRVIEVAGAAPGTGTALTLGNYSGAATQRWNFVPVANPTSTKPSTAAAAVSLYPNPLAGTPLTLEFSPEAIGKPVQVDVFNLQGLQVYHQADDLPSATLRLTLDLAPSLYTVRVRVGQVQSTHTLCIQ